MVYILITELESTGSISCKIKGLPVMDLALLEMALNDLHIKSARLEDCFEADTNGVNLLNMLSKFHYKIVGQSMVIEKSNIGGRTVLIQILVWTLEKAT
ncbi:uncharacterized protein LOC126372629 [Pectinophora gossypiella]|uniref:uncharacterized protein LOC126372629 n=1 Tax=Pectinophora gossypiella TaxID=13191 RepID=UPI00214E2E31|nr:uncharacterized protein LOC126372629 [Pectinophora gossypiella]